MLKAFSIKDSKAEVYLAPFFKPVHGEAERYFHKLVNDKQTMMHDYPEDYSLWYVGEYDEHTGLLKSKEPTHLLNAVALKGQQLSV